MVFQDGQAFKDEKGDMRAQNVMDNLIYRREIPVMIGVFINPGRRPDQPEPTPRNWGDRDTNRPTEYNSLDDKYARVITEELMPALAKDYNISKDPEMHGIGGSSSGAIAAFTVAWERPDHFRKVLSNVGSFVNLRGGHVYPEKVLATEKKPIRVYLCDGRNDNRGLRNGKYDEKRDWFYQNVRLMKALTQKGYDVNYSWGMNNHGQKFGGAIMPEMMRWLWRDGPVSTDPKDVVERGFSRLPRRRTSRPARFHSHPGTIGLTDRFITMTPLDRSRRSFLKTSVALAGTTPLIAGSLQAQSGEASGPLIAYVGTFSSPLRDVLPTQVDLPPGNGRGIHLFQVNRATGAMTPAGIHEMGTSPSCLVLNAAGTRLYSANETDRVGDDKEGTVSAFAIDRADGHLTLLNTVRSGGAGPTYVSIHPSGRFVLVANYFGGSVAVLPILPDGRLGNATDIKKDAGKLGPTKATNAPPGSFAMSGHDRTHAHMIQADPAGRFVLHVDLGLDQIFVWKFDEQTGVLTPNEPHAVSLPPGDGPRHFHFHPNGRWFYSIQEEASTIVLFDYDAATGRLAPRQTISTLPPGFAGTNFCSEILVSADGQFVYAGNRLHDSIGIFSVGPNGDLTFVGEEWTRGDYPRSFNFDPTGQFLYCCNQRGDNIAVFQVNRKTGGLKFTGHYTPVGNPSSIVFLDLARVL